MNAKALVLMKKENGILEKELGSYNIQEGIEYVFKAYVEDNSVKLLLSTCNDVSDDEYSELFDSFDMDVFINEGIKVEEIDDEFNPVWIFIFPFDEEHMIVEDKLNWIIKKHTDMISQILSDIKNN